MTNHQSETRYQAADAVVARVEALLVFLHERDGEMDPDAFDAACVNLLSQALHVHHVPRAFAFESLHGFMALDAVAALLKAATPRARDLATEVMISADHFRHLPGAEALNAAIDAARQKARARCEGES